jgi:hypothetical protein
MVSNPQVVFEGKASICFGSGAYFRYVSISKRIATLLTRPASRYIRPEPFSRELRAERLTAEGRRDGRAGHKMGIRNHFYYSL